MQGDKQEPGATLPPCGGCGHPPRVPANTSCSRTSSREPSVPSSSKGSSLAYAGQTAPRRLHCEPSPAHGRAPAVHSRRGQRPSFPRPGLGRDRARPRSPGGSESPTLPSAAPPRWARFATARSSGSRAAATAAATPGGRQCLSPVQAGRYHRDVGGGVTDSRRGPGRAGANGGGEDGTVGHSTHLWEW
jgi:hypothetical protein